MHKRKTRAIAAFDDFNEELKESEVLNALSCGIGCGGDAGKGADDFSR